MSDRTCAVEGCQRPYRCSGYCGLHYDRMRKTGTTDLPTPVQRICQVPGCGRKHNCQGYCAAHYARLINWGSARPDIPIKVMPTVDERDDIVGRILKRSVRVESGCVEWRGHVDPSGYGSICWDKRNWPVHRAIWTVVVGPIPDDDDWTIDHLCSNRRCVNVGHLEVVTRIVNSERGGGLHRAQLVNAKRASEATCCGNGHPWTDENTMVSKGRRYCRACKKSTWARQREQLNAERRATYAKRRAAGIPWRQARLAS